jgi:hypothetical protein
MSKPMRVILAVLVVAGVALIWNAIRQTKAYNEHNAALIMGAYGPEILNACKQQYPERLGPVAPDARFVLMRDDTVEMAGLPQARMGNKKTATHIVCALTVRTAGEPCAYDGGRTLARFRHDVTVRLVDLKAKAVVATWKVTGGLPNCPSSIRTRGGQIEGPSVLDGADPSYTAELMKKR